MARSGRRPRLSQELIVSAAAAVIAREGMGRFTIQRLADELHSSPMAIFRHLRDKDHLIVLLLDKLVRDLPQPDMPADPRERVLLAFQVMHDGLVQHPWVVEILSAGDLMAPAVLWLMEEIVSGFAACGLSMEQAAAAYRMLWRFTVGEMVIRDATTRRTRQLGRQPFQLSVLEGAPAHELPAIAAASQHWSSARGRDTYAEDLRDLVDGLLARHGRLP
jgi:AcrR family transcriptional regulator